MPRQAGAQRRARAPCAAQAAAAAPASGGEPRPAFAVARIGRIIHCLRLSDSGQQNADQPSRRAHFECRGKPCRLTRVRSVASGARAELTAVLDNPSAASNAIRARWASPAY